jgi:nitroreductase
LRLNLTVDEVLTTTRAVRKRLDLDRHVSREVLLECLKLAIQAPTGGNSNRWRWLFVEDADKKKALADIYRRAAEPYFNSPPPRFSDGDPRGERLASVTESGKYLLEHLHEVPVMLIPCIQGRQEDAPSSASFWASLLPAAWSFMLALRSRGLGSTWTSLHLYGDGEKQAADLLGVPFDEYSQGGLLPIAYTKGTDFRPAKRLPVEQVVSWGSW